MELQPVLGRDLSSYAIRRLMRQASEDDELDEDVADRVADWLTLRANEGMPVPSWCAHAIAAAEVAMLWQAFGRPWTGDEYMLILDALCTDGDSGTLWRPGPERCIAVALEQLLADRALRERYGDLRQDGLSRRQAATDVCKA
jgi:hypothetical protein